MATIPFLTNTSFSAAVTVASSATAANFITTTDTGIDINGLSLTRVAANSAIRASNGLETLGLLRSYAGLTVTGNMSFFETTLTNNDDWQNSPISINERDNVSSNQSADKYAPNLNFHWGGVVSNSLWLGYNGQLNYGSYSSAGIPSADGRINAGTFAGDFNGTINTVTTGTTQTAGNNTTLIATTAFVTTAVASAGAGVFLPLTAGSTKPLTGDLFINSSLYIKGGNERIYMSGGGATNWRGVEVNSTGLWSWGETGIGNYFSKNVGIGATSNNAGDTNNGVPKFQVNTATAVLGEFPLAARFTANSDAGDNSGVSVLINSGNDRGLMISAGRQAGNVAKVTLNVVENTGAELSGITILQNGQGGASANVGIGAASPETKLTVENASGGPASTTYATTASKANLHLSAVGVPFYNHLFMGIGSATYAWIQAQHGNSVAQNLALNPIGGNVGIGTDSPIGKLYVGPTWDTSAGGNDLYIKSTSVDNDSYDPQLVNTTNLGITMVTDSATTTGPDTIGLTLYNNDETAGGFSPMLLFSKLETTPSKFKATMAGIYARSPLGTGNSDAWIDGELIFATAGAASQGIKQRMVINKEGNVGIGTNSPDVSLDVRRDASSGNAKIMVGNSTATLNQVNSGTIVFTEGGTNENMEITYNGATNKLLFNSPVDSTTGLLTIERSGDVGIGAISPGAKLDINGDVLIKSGEYLSWGTVGATSIEGSTVSNKISFRTSSSEKMLIDSAGVKVNDNLITLRKTRGIATNYATSEGWLAGAASTFTSRVGYFGNNFENNGPTGENKVEYDLGPFNSRELIWKTVPETGNNSDGGWNKNFTTLPGILGEAGFMSIVYVKRPTATETSGNFYHGCSGSNTLNLDGNANNNPYFQAIAQSGLPENVWCVSIGIIQANDDANTTGSALGGIYRLDTGAKIFNAGTFKQISSSLVQEHRVYHYYSTSTTARLEFAQPGFYAIDGSEPTLSDLTAGAAGAGVYLPLAGGTMTGTIVGRTAGSSSANPPTLQVVSSGTSDAQAAIAIQQKTAEGDTIIFADYDPYVEYGISTENGSDSIHFTGGTTAGSLGSRTFYNNAGNARTAHTKFKVELGSGNVLMGGVVGIGTATPGDKLDVNGNILLGATDKIGWRYTTGNVSYNFITGENQILTLNGGTWTSDVNQTAVRIKTILGEKVTVKNSGNVGIGTTDPKVLFHVATASSTNAQAGISNSGTGNARLYMDASNGDFIGSDYMSIGQNDDLSGSVEMASSGGPFHITTGNSYRLTVLQTGKVGIFDTNPVESLSIPSGRGVMLGKKRFMSSAGTVPAGSGPSYNFSPFLNEQQGTTLTTQHQYKIYLTTTGTGTYNSAVYIVYQNSASTQVWVSHRVSSTGLTSNYPQLTVSGTNVLIYNLHPSAYSVTYRVETSHSGQALTSPEIFGSDYMWTKDNTDLYYLGGDVGVGTLNPTARFEVDNSTYNANKGIATFINGNNPVRVAYDTVVVSQQDVPCLSIIETIDGAQANEQKLTFAVGDGSAVIGSSVTATNGLYINTNRPTNSPGYSTTAGTNVARFLNNGYSIFTGKVGMGTTGPTTRLTINGDHSGDLAARMNIYYPGSQADRNAYLDMWASEPGVTYNGSGMGSNILGTPYYGKKTSTQGMAYIRFVSGTIGLWAGPVADNVATERITIEPDGDVGIGDSTPSYKLDVNGTIRATGDIIAYSDARVKENIKTIDNALNKIDKLRGVEFNKIGEDIKSIGVIAQEIEKVIPEVVREDDKGMKSVAYGNISGLLIEAIKELKAEIDLLKSKPCTCNKCNCNI